MPAMNTEAGREPIIDCHQHVNWGGRDEKGLIAYLDSVGVAKCWLLSWEAVDGGLEPTYQHLSIRDVLRAWEMFPERIVPFAGVDHRRPDAERMLRECVARGARGYGEIKLHACYDNPDAIRMFRLAGELGLPAIVHLQYPGPRDPQWWYGGTIAALERAVAACPRTTFLGHAQSWWAHVSADGQAEKFEVSYPAGPVGPGGETVRLLETYPNLYGDLSANSGLNAISRDPEFGRKFLNDFADKLLYGVDGYTDRLLQQLRSYDLPAEVFAKITSRNARRLLASG